MIDKFFVGWALVAVVLTYGGIIIGGYSYKKIWRYVATVGQLLGGVGLFAILFYLLIQ